MRTFWRIILRIGFVVGGGETYFTDCSRPSDQADEGRVKYLITSNFPEFDQSRFECKWT